MLDSCARAGAWGGKACGAGEAAASRCSGRPSGARRSPGRCADAGARLIEAPPTARGLEFEIEER